MRLPVWLVAGAVAQRGTGAQEDNANEKMITITVPKEPFEVAGGGRRAEGGEAETGTTSRALMRGSTVGQR